LDADSLFRDTLEWLRQHYGDYRFRLERDLVWTIEERLCAVVEERRLPLRVFGGYPIGAARPRRMNVDIALLDEAGRLALAAEFKYEPDHQRGGASGDVWPTKLVPSVVFWTGEGSVLKDVQRINELVASGWAAVAYLVFVDEGGQFRRYPPHPGAAWQDWNCGGLRPRQVSVLLARAPQMAV
jgi:hypothetical protein